MVGKSSIQRYLIYTNVTCLETKSIQGFNLVQVTHLTYPVPNGFVNVCLPPFLLPHQRNANKEQKTILNNKNNSSNKNTPILTPF